MRRNGRRYTLNLALLEVAFVVLLLLTLGTTSLRGGPEALGDAVQEDHAIGIPTAELACHVNPETQLQALLDQEQCPLHAYCMYGQDETCSTASSTANMAEPLPHPSVQPALTTSTAGHVPPFDMAAVFQGLGRFWYYGMWRLWLQRLRIANDAIYEEYYQAAVSAFAAEEEPLPAGLFENPWAEQTQEMSMHADTMPCSSAGYSMVHAPTTAVRGQQDMDMDTCPVPSFVPDDLHAQGHADACPTQGTVHCNASVPTQASLRDRQLSSHQVSSQGNLESVAMQDMYTSRDCMSSACTGTVPLQSSSCPSCTTESGVSSTIINCTSEIDNHTTEAVQASGSTKSTTEAVQPGASTTYATARSRPGYSTWFLVLMKWSAGGGRHWRAVGARVAVPALRRWGIKSRVGAFLVRVELLWLMGKAYVAATMLFAVPVLLGGALWGLGLLLELLLRRGPRVDGQRQRLWQWQQWHLQQQQQQRLQQEQQGGHYDSPEHDLLLSS